MKKRSLKKCLFVVTILTGIIFSSCLTYYHTDGGDAKFLQDKTLEEPYPSDGKIQNTRGYNIHSVPNLRVSAGIQGLSYTLGKTDPKEAVGYLSKVTPIQLNFCLMQYGLIEWILNPESGKYKTKVTVQQTWTPAVGFAISKDMEEDTEIGFTVIPYQFIRNEFSVGIGCEWIVNKGDSLIDIRNFTLIMPLTYQLDF
jgi:hypothetical protein